MLIKSKNWADLCPIISKLLKQKVTVISFLIYVAITMYQAKINTVLRNDRLYQKDTEVNLLPKMINYTWIIRINQDLLYPHNVVDANEIWIVAAIKLTQLLRLDIQNLAMRQKVSFCSTVWLPIIHVILMMNITFWKRLQKQIEKQWPPEIRGVLQNYQDISQLMNCRKIES